MDFCGSCGRPASDGHAPGCPYAAPQPLAPPRPPQGTPPPTQPKRKVGAAVIAVVAGLVLFAVLGATILLRGNGSGSVASDAVTASPSAPVVTATATVVVSPRAQPSASASSATVRSLPSGSWLAVLESLPQAEQTESMAQAQATSLSTGAGSVVVVDSTAIPGLNPGYWALSLIGFSSSVEARDACARVQRSPGPSCYDRQVR